MGEFVYLHSIYKEDWLHPYPLLEAAISNSTVSLLQSPQVWFEARTSKTFVFELPTLPSLIAVLYWEVFRYTYISFISWNLLETTRGETIRYNTVQSGTKTEIWSFILCMKKGHKIPQPTISKLIILSKHFWTHPFHIHMYITYFTVFINGWE